MLFSIACRLVVYGVIYRLGAGKFDSDIANIKQKVKSTVRNIIDSTTGTISDSYPVNSVSTEEFNRNK